MKTTDPHSKYVQGLLFLISINSHSYTISTISSIYIDIYTEAIPKYVRYIHLFSIDHSQPAQKVPRAGLKIF